MTGQVTRPISRLANLHPSSQTNKSNRATPRQGAVSSMMTSSASSPYDPANPDGQSANTSNERDPILDNNSIMGNNSGSGISVVTFYTMRLCDASPELLKLIKDSEKKYEKSLSNKSTSSNVTFLLNHEVEELLAESSEYIDAFQPTDLMVESNQIVTEVSRQTNLIIITDLN
ncbi:hypothetical protein C1646_808997 [Rhizophagus diaphanus]|nr:hypothetical protein C1646_808997 [Rhizophagus diaphanus] [Rhizophagus sp. MUCL 43196]